MPSSEFCYSSWPQSENERKWKDRQILRSSKRAKKAVEHEGDTNCSWCTWKIPKVLEKRSEKELRPYKQPY